MVKDTTVTSVNCGGCSETFEVTENNWPAGDKLGNPIDCDTHTR